MRPMFETIRCLDFGLRADKMVGVEIGVFEGNNAFEVLYDLKPKMLHMVDNGAWGGTATLEKRLATHNGSNWKYFNGKSSEVAKELKHLDFVYIDAEHDYESVKQDIELWWPNVVEGGIFGGHDYLNETTPGVRQAVNEFVSKNNLELHIKDLDWWVTK